MRAFSIPESRADQVAWLESEIVGTELHSLIAELVAVHGAQADQFELDQAIIHAVRKGGLAELNDHQFTQLLKHAELLTKLQQDVLEHGGQYWSEVDSPADLPHPTPFVHANSRTHPSLEPAPAPASRSSFGSNALWLAIGSLATAAAILLFVRPTNTSSDTNSEIAKTTTVPVEQVAVKKPAWGFSKFAANVETEEEQLEPPLGREAYLRELASAAEAWTNKRPDNSAALAQRIGEFRMGCSAILMATHGPLPEADRVWLRDRCRSWAKALDRHLADTENGVPVEQVRSAVDTTVIKIAAAILGRADTPTG